ncbi:hypothetical protein [Roseibium album]|uniref:hypothetical protein n=1 Tax=Roseibium album TaxID=311410 RepID=UPI002490E1DA|nr:hypothetical protein [Roseibium album]
MSVSKTPVHKAERLLEKAQALLSVICTLADSEDDDTWQEIRHGVSLISHQAKQATDDALDQLDKA